jgi:hypothetical protein
MIDKAFFEVNPDRAVVGIGGEDRVAFLQGLVSNDVRRVSEERALYAALLTPQGKFAHDMMLVGDGVRYLVDVESARRAALLQRLEMFRLRSKVTLEDLDASHVVINLFGGDAFRLLGLSGTCGSARAFAGGVAFVDPRLAELGARTLLPRAGAEGMLERLGFTAARPGTHRRLRLSLGVPEGSLELLPEKSILLESGFEELGGIDWQKGCYMGQELTARTKYRGLVRKRLLPVRIEGPAPAAGSILMLDGREAGELRVAEGDVGLALVRLEHVAELSGTGVVIDGARITVTVPHWMKLPEMT